MKQARKTPLKCCHQFVHGPLVHMCYTVVFRINHVAKTISLLASRMPVWLEVFLQFSFSDIVFMFYYIIHCSVLRSGNSRKAFKFLSKHLVLLLYGNQYRNLCFVHKTTYLWSMRNPGVGNCLFLRAGGWGIYRQVRTELQIPRGMPGGGGGEMVTGRIEPCIR